MDRQDLYLNEEGVRTLWAAIKVELTKKVNLSELDNYLTDEEVEAAILSALTNYMTTDQVASAIASAISAVKTIKFQIVESLPETGEGNVIYFVASETAGDPNIYDEYVWINGKFELIGNTSIDLSQYWSKTELSSITSDQLKEILV